MVAFFLFFLVIIVASISGAVYYRNRIFGGPIQTNPLKETGRLVSVKSSDIKILSRDYFEDTQVEITRSTMIDSLFTTQSPQKQHKFISVLVYETENAGVRKRYVSQPIYKSEPSLLSLLKNINYMNIYIDKNDPDKYYFDISLFAGRI